MLEQFEELRDEIRRYATKEKDYKKVIQLCFLYLNQINNLKDNITNSDRSYIHYEIALNSKKQGDYNTAIKHGLIALNYLTSSELEGSNKLVNRLWLLASCYQGIGNIEEAKKLYYKCSRLFRNIHEENQRAMIIFNNAKLTKNFKAMRKIIKIYETKTLKTVTITHGDMEYDDILKSFYTELFELYILENRQEAFKLLYIIKSKSLRKELAVKFVA